MMKGTDNGTGLRYEEGWLSVCKQFALCGQEEWLPIILGDRCFASSMYLEIALTFY